MWKSIQSLDRILKGEATRLGDLRRGTIDVPLGGLSLVILVLGAFYGACMGAFAIIDRHGQPDAASGYAQLAASAVKVPTLFFLTLVVTFPSLYVFNALVGSRLSMGALLRLLVAALGVMMALLAAFGTIVVFFAVSTDSYAFMVLLNVVLFAVSGVLGLGFLLQTLHRLYNAQFGLPPTSAGTFGGGGEGSAGLPPDGAPVPYPPAPPDELRDLPEPGALDRIEGQVSSANVRTVFKIWVIVFSLVGAQMGWVLRPFIGDPSKPFTFFRPRESNFFHDVFRKLGDLMEGENRRRPPSYAPAQGAGAGPNAAGANATGVNGSSANGAGGAGGRRAPSAAQGAGA